MKKSPALKNNFYLLKKASSVMLVLMIVLFACNKDKRDLSINNSASDRFFEYSGSDTLIIKTLEQLRTLNNRVPFADSLSTIGAIQWNAYIKSVGVGTPKKNLYKIMVPYVNKQNILAGYIDISPSVNGISTKPITYNYEKDYLNNKDLIQRFFRGNSFQSFGQKNITLPQGFISLQKADSKQMALTYTGKPRPQVKINTNGIKKTTDFNQCEKIYEIYYSYHRVGINQNYNQGEININNQYVSTLQTIYGPNVQISLSEQGLVLQGGENFLDEVNVGYLWQCLANTSYVNEVTSITLISDLCSTSCGGSAGGAGTLKPLGINLPPCVTAILNSISASAFQVTAVATIFNDPVNVPDSYRVGTMLNAVMNDPNYPIVFSSGNNYPGTNAATSPSALYPATSELQNSYINSATALSVARTIIHETIHGYFQYGLAHLQNDPNFVNFQAINSALFDTNGNPQNDQNLAQHNQIAQDYVHGIASMLEIYANNNSITSPDPNRTLLQYCTDLSWAGLFGTNAYLSLQQTDRDRIHDTALNEQDKLTGSTQKKACP